MQRFSMRHAKRVQDPFSKKRENKSSESRSITIISGIFTATQYGMKKTCACHCAIVRIHRKSSHFQLLFVDMWKVFIRKFQFQTMLKTFHSHAHAHACSLSFASFAVLCYAMLFIIAANDKSLYRIGKMLYVLLRIALGCIAFTLRIHIDT